MGGDFVSKKDLDQNAKKNQNLQNRQNNENIKSKSSENFGQGLFDSDNLNPTSVQPIHKTFSPPEGWVPNDSDFTQPAIWKKTEFGRSIKLSDD